LQQLVTGHAGEAAKELLTEILQEPSQHLLSQSRRETNDVSPNPSTIRQNLVVLGIDDRSLPHHPLNAIIRLVLSLTSVC
jgi:hypothetical protein